MLVAHDSEQAPMNRQQWYVGISRARRKVVVFTSDKEALRLNVERESDRELALSIKPDEATVEVVREELLLEAFQQQLSLKAQQRLHESLRQWVPPPQQQQQPQQDQSINRGISI